MRPWLFCYRFVFLMIRFLFFRDALENLEGLGLLEAAWHGVNKDCRIWNQTTWIDMWAVARNRYICQHRQGFQ